MQAHVHFLKIFFMTVVKVHKAIFEGNSGCLRHSVIKHNNWEKENVQLALFINVQ